MAEGDQAEEMTRAADRFAESARELTGSLDRFLDFQQALERRLGEYYALAGERWTPRWGTLSEEESVALALRAVQEVRQEKTRDFEWEHEERLRAPSPDEVRKRREERRKREAEEDDS